MEFNPGASRFKVGDVVNPSVKLTYKRDPLLNSKVSALLIGPGDDLADKIARDEVKYFDPSSDPNKGTLYTQKLSKLLENDPLYLKKFADQNQKNTIDLTDPGNEGIYSGDFGSAVAMTGVYHLIYFIEHYDGGDTIVRQKRLTLLVNPDDIDLDASELSVEQGEGNRTLLTINPTDTRGRRLGLGLNFHLVANNAQIESILPHLDGSYTLKITGELKGNGELTVLDIPVFKGNLQKLTCYSGNTNFFQKIQCWIWSLGLPMWIFWLILIIIIILIWIILRRRP